ncbi:Transglutaminase-like superfamily protein [Caulifigura coniformis]|uniref:Transglutaminase-like superfamily protein n=1 Tax=Caulifigura coniformis TaxID=2527983 RepID=A0A517S8X2_9PLAN|nr:transglutaminase family protein [Caulifigura coniformis]QDT52553.1 Transglutaminase-like superfamily protein [Caulifigura coniformis]
MKRLRIEHRTTYTYPRPVQLGRHRLVIRPREGHDLRVESMTLEISPAHRRVWTCDVFGNNVVIVDFLEATTQLEIFSDVVVRRTTLFPDFGLHERGRIAWPVVYDPLEQAATSIYLNPTYPDDIPQVRAWLQAELPPPEPLDAEDMVGHLTQLIQKKIQYQRRSEKGVQSPAETLRLGSGSCRDMATLMMDACRSLGIASRFVSGYLDCAASEAGRAATHAWNEVYFPAYGWRGFDPTIGQPTSTAHVTAGVSNHPRGVMPVAGMFLGGQDDRGLLSVTVKVERLSG